VSSLDVLAPVLRRGRHAGQVNVGLFRMPQHDSLAGRLLPPRYREGVGVQHMKVYAFDDTVVLSGANLSHDYFTTRQDRCVVVRRAGDFAAAMHELVELLTAHSHTVASDGVHAVTPPPPQRSTAAFAASLRQWAADDGVSDGGGVRSTISSGSSGSSSNNRNSSSIGNRSGSSDDDSDVVVITPQVQFAAHGVHQDARSTTALLQSLRAPDDVVMATGYFNFPDTLASTVIHDCAAQRVRIVTAAPSANGFYGARFISGSVPLGYSEIERHFVQRCRQVPGRGDAIRMLEFCRPGWTFHGKGLWINCGADDGAVGTAADSGAKVPYVTAVGSPNFGRRSFERDLELQLVCRSSNPSLRRALADECSHMLRHSEPVTDATWTQPQRRLHGWSWSNGAWIRVGWRFFSPLL
jgi:CDP-diacylglycerol--glycerol-3-phosphate 3-phosphatidyltransferase